MINVWIDELTPCLRDTQTGDIIETEVIRIKRKSFLQKFNKKTGWYVNWGTLSHEYEIYALVIKGTVDIQGLVALKPENDYKAIYIAWMCTAPHNNKVIANTQKYKGVGGHLFAIAADKSIEYGFNGAITGFAMNKALVKHYADEFGAEHLGILHPNQILIKEEKAYELIKEYDYEWTDDEL